jgi:CRP-like cAMP-binding protein
MGETRDNLTDLLTLAPPSLRRATESALRTIKASKGRTLVSVGARATDIFFVKQGEVRAVLYSSNGREVTMQKLVSGDSFGELSALDGLPRSASVVALSEVRLVVMARRDFLGLLESTPGAALWLAGRLGADVRRLTDRVFELSALNVRARLNCELLRLARDATGEPPFVDGAPTHGELANRIGATREAVSREMLALASRRIVRLNRRRLEFLDITGLVRLVRQHVGDDNEAE